jgi:hypothetical protein
MKEFDSIEQLIKEYKNLQGDAFIYASSSIIEEENLELGKYLVMESEEEDELIETEDDSIPKQAYDRNMVALIEVETFKDIISFQNERNPSSNYKNYMEAIGYYLSYDDFLDD